MKRLIIVAGSKPDRVAVTCDALKKKGRGRTMILSRPLMTPVLSPELKGHEIIDIMASVVGRLLAMDISVIVNWGRSFAEAEEWEDVAMRYECRFSFFDADKSKVKTYAPEGDGQWREVEL